MTRKNQKLPTQTDVEGAVVSQGLDKNENPLVLESGVAKAIRIEVRKAIVSESYSGPMPKPDHMDRYNQIVPGAAKDILEEFKANGAHSRKVELIAVKGAVDNDSRGQWMAFFLVALGFGLVAYLATINQGIVAGIVAGTLLVAVIAGFLSKKIFNAKESVDSSEVLETSDLE